MEIFLKINVKKGILDYYVSNVSRGTSKSDYIFAGNAKKIPSLLLKLYFRFCFKFY